MYLNFPNPPQIPEALRNRLEINLHSAVRLKPVNTTPRVALSVRLQPVQTMVMSPVAQTYCKQIIYYAVGYCNITQFQNTAAKVCGHFAKLCNFKGILSDYNHLQSYVKKCRKAKT